MSRTRPQLSQAWELVKRSYEAWRTDGGYPPAVRGAWSGQKLYAHFRWKSFRAKEREALERHDEESLPSYRRGGVKWDVW